MKSAIDKSVYNGILRERVELYGVDTLMDEEVISMLTGISINQIKKYIEQYGLCELIRFISTLRSSKSQQKKLELLYQFSKRLGASRYLDKHVLNSSKTAGEFFVSQLQFLSHEVFMVAFLNTQNKLLSLETVSVGTINEAIVYPREVVRLAIQLGCHSVILAHNHPGSSLSPSPADIDVTKKISAALKTISVSVIDHIIVAENRFTSFAEKGLL